MPFFIWNKEKHCILSDCQCKESRVLSVTLPGKSHYKLWQHFSSGKFCFFKLPETLGTSGSLDCFSGVLSFKMFLCHPTFFDINTFLNKFILCGVKWWENIFENYVLWSSSITCKIWHFAYIFNTQGLLSLFFLKTNPRALFLKNIRHVFFLNILLHCLQNQAL